MNIIIITGASSGLGLEFAFQMDSYFSNIDEIWLVARRKERLEAVAKVMNHKTRIIPIDITDSDAMYDFEDLLKVHDVKVRMLINCAGYGIIGGFTETRLKEQLGMVRLNCEALTKMTYLCLPYMKKNSRIIQLASSAAFLPQQNFAVYAATKSYVLSFSRALNKELAARKIYVTAVCPGPVDTDFFSIAEKHGESLGIKKYVLASPDMVIKQALRDSYYKKEVSVYSLPIKAFRLLAKYTPHKLLLGLMQYMK